MRVCVLIFHLSRFCFDIISMCHYFASLFPLTQWDTNLILQLHLPFIYNNNNNIKIMLFVTIFTDGIKTERTAWAYWKCVTTATEECQTDFTAELCNLQRHGNAWSVHCVCRWNEKGLYFLQSPWCGQMRQSRDVSVTVPRGNHWCFRCCWVMRGDWSTADVGTC